MAYRVGIVGCGGMGRWYAKSFRAMNAEVVGCVDPDEGRAQALVDEVGGKAYVQHQEMLERERPDIVAVCTWPSTHREVTVDAAQAGAKGIITEKPIAVTLADADEMISECEKHGATLVIGHQHRLSPWARKARELIVSGAIGEVQLIWGHCTLDLMNNGTHVIDTIHALNGDEPMEWVLGQIDCSSQIFGQRNHPDLYAEDSSVGRIHYANGVEALIDLGVRARQEFAFKVVGTDGLIQAEMGSVRYIGKDSNGWQRPELPQGLGGREKIEDLIHAMEKGTEPQSSGRRGRAALEVIVGVFASVKRRGIVEAPVQEDHLSLQAMVEAGIV